MDNIHPPADAKRAAEPDNLFIQFAQLPEDAKALQKFAARHGTLDGGIETADKWKGEIANMRLAIQLWLDLERVRGGVIEKDVEVAFPPPPADISGHSIADIGAVMADLFHEEGWSEQVAGRYWLLHNLVHMGVGKRASIRIEPAYKNLTFAAVPTGDNLAGRLWLRLAQAVSEHWQLRACQQCRTPFQRTDPRAKYCSQACKVAASRARTKENERT